MNPQNRTRLDLNRKQRRLFDEHVRLADMAFSKYRAACPDAFQDDLRQTLLISLAHWCKAYDGRLPFGQYVWPKLKSSALNFLFGRRRFGSAALKNAALRERSADEPIGEDEDGSILTRGVHVENKLAKTELNARAGDDRHAARLHDIRRAVTELRSLTAFERRVLKLRFIDGLDRHALTKRLRCSLPHLVRTTHRAVGKLRAHFRAQGLPALAMNAPLPRYDDHHGKKPSPPRPR